MGETYYDVLEIDPEASRDEIESAYRERVIETHPDHNDAPDATEQFQRVARAKDVLSDGDERARYDRLGHDAYVSLAEHARDADSPPTQSATENHTGADTDATSDTSSSHHSTGTASERTSASWSSAASTGSTSATTQTSSGTYAGSSARRTGPRAATATAGTTSDSVGDPSRSSSGLGSETVSSEAQSGFRYTVHDWDGQIDFEWPGRQITDSTAVTVGCLWLLYPAFVATSVLPGAPLPVNVILAACTVAVVGYLLTWPRLSAVFFGSWSLLFLLGLVTTDAVGLFSILGLTALGFAWVPFGYALGLWWALQP